MNLQFWSKLFYSYVIAHDRPYGKTLIYIIRIFVFISIFVLFLKVLTYPLILGDTKNNGLIALTVGLCHVTYAFQSESTL